MTPPRELHNLPGHSLLPHLFLSSPTGDCDGFPTFRNQIMYYLPSCRILARTVIQPRAVVVLARANSASFGATVPTSQGGGRSRSSSGSNLEGKFHARNIAERSSGSPDKSSDTFAAARQNCRPEIRSRGQVLMARGHRADDRGHRKMQR